MIYNKLASLIFDILSCHWIILLVRGMNVFVLLSYNPLPHPKPCNNFRYFIKSVLIELIWWSLRYVAIVHNGP